MPSAPAPSGIAPLREAAPATRRTEADAPAGLRAARQAQAVWRTWPIRERLALLRRFRHLAAARAEAFAPASARSRQRPIGETLTAEVLPLLDACRFLERQAARILAPQRCGFRGRPLWLFGARAEIRREPRGLILILGPANYPLFLPGVQVLQALAAGNAVALKPGIGGSPAARLLGETLTEAGLPPHLCQVWEEDPASVSPALEAGVDLVVLTGSAETGRTIVQQCGRALTPAIMELSGADPVLVRSDADPDLAARAVVFGLRLNGGATCIAPRRLVVAESLAPTFAGRLCRALESAPPVALNFSQLGPFGTRLARALRSGEARRVGRRADTDPDSAGPLVYEVAPDSELWAMEWFGPVALLTHARNDDEAVHLANRSPFALGAAIFTRDSSAATRLAEALRAGVVTINDLIVPTADPRLPFGGRARSGFGVTRGAEGLLAMTAPKVVSYRAGAWRPHYEETPPEAATLFGAYARWIHGQGLGSRWRALREMLAAARAARGNRSKPDRASHPTVDSPL